MNSAQPVYEFGAIKSQIMHKNSLQLAEWNLKLIVDEYSAYFSSRQ